MGRITDKAAPCGVYCGACPSFEKTCWGCGSADKNQKRKSKWGCKIRSCCFDERNLDFCIDCEDFPCNLTEKLKNSYFNQDKFQYRHEIYDNLEKIKEIGVQSWVQEQQDRFKCPQCGGLILWYKYQCNECGMNFFPR